jgi:hypothetical protein
LGGVLGVVGKPSASVRYKRVYFTILRANMQKILILEWILLLEIQTICKK